MKLSEAMMLGMSAYRMEPSHWVCRDGGCLLGVAGRAAGIKFVPLDWDEFVEDIELIIREWPWIEEKYFPVPEFARSLHEFNYDCPYSYVAFTRQPQDAKSIISFLANHVYCGNVSVEAVADWVRSVEPQEPDQEQVSERGGTRSELTTVDAS